MLCYSNILLTKYEEQFKAHADIYTQTNRILFERFTQRARHPPPQLDMRCRDLTAFCAKPKNPEGSNRVLQDSEQN